MLPAAFVFCFGGKFVFGGRAFACTAGFFPRFGGSSVARPGGRDDVSIVPYKSFAAFITIGKVFHSAHTPAGVPLNHIPCNDGLQI